MITFTITRQATRQPDEPLNILTMKNHPRYDENLCKTGHNFYSFSTPQTQGWNDGAVGSMPNYYDLGKFDGELHLPIHLDIDLILSHNRFGQIQLAKQLAKQLHLGIVNVEHTVPPKDQWAPGQFHELKHLRGDINVYISDFNKSIWEDDSGISIHHTIDTNKFNISDAQR